MVRLFLTPLFVLGLALLGASSAVVAQTAPAVTHDAQYYQLRQNPQRTLGSPAARDRDRPWQLAGRDYVHLRAAIVVGPAAESVRRATLTTLGKTA